MAMAEYRIWMGLKETEGEVKPFTLEQRIELRKYYNKILNIYQ
jgi:hypothetical protein